MCVSWWTQMEGISYLNTCGANQRAGCHILHPLHHLMSCQCDRAENLRQQAVIPLCNVWPSVVQVIFVWTGTGNGVMLLTASSFSRLFYRLGFFRWYLCPVNFKSNQFCSADDCILFLFTFYTVSQLVCKSGCTLLIPLHSSMPGGIPCDRWQKRETRRQCFIQISRIWRAISMDASIEDCFSLISFTSFGFGIDLLSGALYRLSSFFFFTDHTPNYIKGSDKKISNDIC